MTELTTEENGYMFRLKQHVSNKRKIRKELEHIKAPYSVNEIIEKYASGDYNAELLLQHALKQLLAPAFND